MSEPKKLILVGAGGAGRDTLWVLSRNKALHDVQRFAPIGFVDDAVELQGKIIDGLPVIGTVRELLENYQDQGIYFHCSLGSNLERERLTAALENVGLVPATVIDPSAIVAESAAVGEGAFIGAGVVVTPHAKVGRHTLINVGAMVGHDSAVGDFAQLCPGVRLTGSCRIGVGAFIGANAVVAPSVTIGAYSVLGAASLAARDVPENVSAIGVPAKIVAPGLKKPSMM